MLYAWKIDFGSGSVCYTVAEDVDHALIEARKWLKGSTASGNLSPVKSAEELHPIHRIQEGKHG